MTPERVVNLVERWVRFYTRGLPAPIARRRVEEIRADLHDHLTYERARGTSDRRIALSILSRMARGLTADASWRAQPLKGKPVKSLPAIIPTVGLGLLVGVVTFLAVMLVYNGGAPFAGVVAGVAAALIYAARRRKRSGQA